MQSWCSPPYLFLTNPNPNPNPNNAEKLGTYTVNDVTVPWLSGPWKTKWFLKGSQAEPAWNQHLVDFGGEGGTTVLQY